MNENLIAINCVAQLFWDYTDSDIKTLRAKSTDFDYVWGHYVVNPDEELYPNTYTLLWVLWFNKFSSDTKQLIADYAHERFGQQLRESLGFEQSIKRMFPK